MHLQAQILSTFRKSLANFRKRTKQLINVGEVQLAITIVRVIKMVIVHHNKVLKTTLKDELTKKHLEKIYLWTFVWALGSTVVSESMDTFEKIVAETFPVDQLPRGSAMDYELRITKQEGKLDVEYEPWEEHIPEFQYTKGMSYFDMVVQTKQTVSFGWFLERVVESNFPIFITGVTGTGKTILINSTVSALRDEGIVTVLGMTFSAKTSSFAA